MLDLCLSQRLIPDSATDSIFPEIEELFDEDSDLYNALKFVSPPDAEDAYRSVMDWLFVSVHPEYRSACRLFYEDKCPPLRNMITELERLQAQARILTLLLEAYKDFCKMRERQWTKRRWRVLCKFARMAA